MRDPGAPGGAGDLVLVTRPSGSDDRLSGLLRDRGYRVASVPTMAYGPAVPGGELDRALADDQGWDWIVVTSVAGALATGEALARTPGRSGRLAAWAAVGPATAAALASLGIAVDLVPREQTGLGLARALSARAALLGCRVLLPRAEAASTDLPEALRNAGADVHEVTAYRTVTAPAESAPGIVAVLTDPDLGAIVVASGSAVRGLVRLAAEAGLSDRVRATPVVAIGPTSREAAREQGLVHVTQASEPTLEALVAAVAAASPTPRSSAPSRAAAFTRRPE